MRVVNATKAKAVVVFVHLAREVSAGGTAGTKVRVAEEEGSAQESELLSQGQSKRSSSPPTRKAAAAASAPAMAKTLEEAGQLHEFGTERCAHVRGSRKQQPR